MERTFLIKIENTKIKVIRRTLEIPDELVNEYDIIEYIQDNYLAEDNEVYLVDFIKQELVKEESYSNVDEIKLVTK